MNDKNQPVIKPVCSLVHTSSFFLSIICHSLEPITWSEQIPCARATSFSWTSLFLEWFWCKFWISFKFHKLVSKAYRPKNDNCCLLIIFSFPFFYLFYLYFQWAHRCGGDSIWVGKKCPEMCLKINLSIKTPWRRPSMEVTCFGLWAP